jgi:hypothetical protein
MIKKIKNFFSRIFRRKQKVSPPQVPLVVDIAVDLVRSYYEKKEGKDEKGRAL